MEFVGTFLQKFLVMCTIHFSNSVHLIGLDAFHFDYTDVPFGQENLLGFG